MALEQKPRERSFIWELIPDWRPTREQVLWAARVAILLAVVLGILTLIGSRFGITLWEWVKLLIVPAVIAGGGIWFNRQQRLRELEIAEQRAQDEALEAYLDQMSQMLTDKEQPLRRSYPGDNLSVVARARTLTVLTRLDGVRKLSILQFLYESKLIAKDRIVLDLKGADLSGADLSGAAGITNEKLEAQSKSLSRATMPNGQKYEEWLKSKGSEEDGENGEAS